MTFAFAKINGVLINLANVGSIRKTTHDDKNCIVFRATNGDILHRFYLPNETARRAYNKLAEYALYDFDEENVPANKADTPATGKPHYRAIEHHVVDDLGNRLGKDGRNWFVYDCADRCAEILNAETTRLRSDLTKSDQQASAIAAAAIQLREQLAMTEKAVEHGHSIHVMLMRRIENAVRALNNGSTALAMNYLNGDFDSTETK